VGGGDRVQSGGLRDQSGKKVIEDQKTLEVPITHEEVTIERRPAGPSDRGRG